MNLNIITFLAIFFVISFIVFPPYLKKKQAGIIFSYSRWYYCYALLLFYLFFCFFYVCRNPVPGNDTFVYLSVFKRIANCVSYSEIRNRHIVINFEKGYVWFVYLISRISASKVFFLSVMGGCIYFSFLNYIHSLSNGVLLSVTFFILFGTFFSATNLMRQFCAISIILYGYKYLLKKKYIKFYIVVCLASLFHSSALICVIIPFINTVKISKHFMLFYLFVLLMMVVFSNRLLSTMIHFVAPKYEHFLSSEIFGIQDTAKLGSLFNFSIGLFILFCFLRNYEINNTVYDKLLKIYMIGLLFTAMSVKFTQINRLSLYFSPAAIVLFGMVKKNIIFYATLVALIGYCLVTNLLRPEWTGFFPYHIDL